MGDPVGSVREVRYRMESWSSQNPTNKPFIWRDELRIGMISRGGVWSEVSREMTVPSGKKRR